MKHKINKYYLITIITIIVVFEVALLGLFFDWKILTLDDGREDNLKVTISDVWQYANLLSQKQLEEPTPKEPEEKPLKISFLGDIMLDRTVESLMNKEGINYPFSKVESFLASNDIVLANLEGPIVNNPPDFGQTSLQFAFSPKVISALNYSHINVVSLANNHTLNMGREGFYQTMGFLDKGAIAYIGDPTECVDDLVYERDGVTFLAFNTTFSSCGGDGILEIVKKIKKINPDQLIIVSLHWGKEYAEQNTTQQQELAHKLIDNGVNVIIGHHPHVVQNIEYYNSSLIFYSLGNFVFDQYFSDETQKGLVVQLEIYEQKMVFELLPVNLENSQPRLMTQKEKDEFLDDIARRSNPQLLENIKKAKIGVKR